MNNKLIELSEKDSIYEDAPPMLLVDQFAKETKEREEQLRCLDKASGRGKSQNFYGRHPQAQHRGAAHIQADKATTVMEGVASTHIHPSSGSTKTEEKKIISRREKGRVGEREES